MGNNKLLACERLLRQGEAALEFTSDCRAIQHSSDGPTAVPLKKNIFSSGSPEPARPELLTGEQLVTQPPPDGRISAGVGSCPSPSKVEVFYGQLLHLARPGITWALSLRENDTTFYF